MAVKFRIFRPAGGSRDHPAKPQLGRDPKAQIRPNVVIYYLLLFVRAVESPVIPENGNYVGKTSI